MSSVLPGPRASRPLKPGLRSRRDDNEGDVAFDERRARRPRSQQEAFENSDVTLEYFRSLISQFNRQISVDSVQPSKITATAPSGLAGSWIRIATIARNTFREAVRDRVLYNLVLFVLLLIAAAIFIGELSGGQERKIIVDLGLSAMLLFGVFIAIFVGVALVYKEIERRTVYAIFSKPVGRGEFLVGKYLGLCLTLLVNVAVMGTGVSLALIYVSRGWDPLVLKIWPAILLIYVELMLITGVALLFSSFSSPASRLVNFFRVPDRTLQRRPEESLQHDGQHRRALVLCKSVLPAAESRKSHFHNAGSSRPTARQDTRARRSFLHACLHRHRPYRSHDDS